MYFSFEIFPAYVWNEPPMVPYKIPIIGHTLDYLFNVDNFLAECKQKYGDPFNIYVFGQVTTVAGSEVAHEVYTNNAFSLFVATRDAFPLYRVLKSFDDLETMEQVIKTIREGITPKLSLYTGRMQKQLLFSINKEIGDCSVPKLIANNNFSIIIARPVADIIVGQEISKNEDVVKAFADFTKDFGSILEIPPILSFIHPNLHVQAITLPLRFGWNPIRKHLLTLKKHLKPELEKRLKEKKILGNKYEPPMDIVQCYLNNPKYETKVITDDYLNKICEFLFIIVVASIHTTTRYTTCALYDFAGRPELWDDIYEEQVRIDKESNGELSLQHINKMVKLDTPVPHKCMETYTLKNGMTIPKDRMVQGYLKDIHHNTSFLPYHGLENNFPASKTDKDYLIFGTGKHACPGRFFAVNEIKILMHKLILNYHIKTPSGKMEKKGYYGPFAILPDTGITFENRKK
ncbi:1762_t:CDS:10 [Diversispora eburnea]|uniref:1762_t:CDS:1 n=1 Tax=Diversispora eburnea TaxID=1213867 RepID=A0A9N9A7R9_9GLOM|nr:1762_t:CDS:10 [Diversispora eburnea]